MYALGATLYHLITNVVPIDAPTRYIAIEDDQPDLLRPADEVNPQVPHAVAALLTQAIAINRKHRPASAAEMRLALHEASLALSAKKQTEPKPSDSVRAVESHQPDGSSEESSPTEFSPPDPQIGHPTEGTTSDVEKKNRDVREDDTSPHKSNKKGVAVAIASLSVVLVLVVYTLMNKSQATLPSIQQEPPVTTLSNQPSPEQSIPPEVQKEESPKRLQMNLRLVCLLNRKPLLTERGIRIGAPSATPKIRSPLEKAKKIFRNPFLEGLSDWEGLPKRIEQALFL